MSLWPPGARASAAPGVITRSNPLDERPIRCDDSPVDATVAEFPFVATLPKREKSRLQTFWEQFEVMKAAMDAHGSLVPATFAARLLGVSKQRVHQLTEAGKLQCIEVNGHSFITEDSMVALAKSERKAGRPPHIKSFADCVEVGIEAACDAYRAAKKNA